MPDMSIAVKCSDSIINSTSFREATSNECRFSKCAGSILLVVAIISFIINIYSLITTSKNRQASSRDQKLVIGMFISSLCVIVISTPPVIIQCFRCNRLHSSLVCRIEGFNSFLNGCATMYILVALSVVRYARTANSIFPKTFQRKIKEHDLSLVIICFIMGGIWAIPPLFGHMSSYVPEGLGFHCGLDWFNKSLPSRVYFFSAFIYVYFIPIIIIIYVNIYIQRTIYRLTHLYPTVLLELNDINNQDFLRKHISNTLCNKAAQRLYCLYEDRRFVTATGISVIIYFIAWTPYGVIALSQVFGESFSLYQPWIMTTCALLAKLSMIINPIIYIIILKSREMTVMTCNEEQLL